MYDLKLCWCNLATTNLYYSFLYQVEWKFPIRTPCVRASPSFLRERFRESITFVMQIIAVQSIYWGPYLSISIESCHHTFFTDYYRPVHVLLSRFYINFTQLLSIFYPYSFCFYLDKKTCESASQFLSWCLLLLTQIWKRKSKCFIKVS